MTTTIRKIGFHEIVETNAGDRALLCTNIKDGEALLNCAEFASALQDGIKLVLFGRGPNERGLSVSALREWTSQKPKRGPRGDFWAIALGPKSDCYPIVDSDRPGNVLLDAGIHGNHGYHNPTLKRLIERLRRAKVQSFTILPFESTYGSIKIER